MNPLTPTANEFISGLCNGRVPLILQRRNGQQTADLIRGYVVERVRETQ